MLQMRVAKTSQHQTQTLDLSWVGRFVVCGMQGRCPWCGKIIDLSKLPVEHHCPYRKEEAPRGRTETLILDNGIVIIAGRREDVVPVVQDMIAIYRYDSIIAILF